MRLHNLIFSCAVILLTACGGGDTSKSKLTMDEADIVAGRFLDSLSEKLGNDLLAQHEIEVISQAELFKPPLKCFDLWYARGELIPTPELINECAIHVRAVQNIYNTYGYEPELTVFKSPWFWQHADELNWKELKKLVGTNGLYNSDCAIANQVGYDEVNRATNANGAQYSWCER